MISYLVTFWGHAEEASIACVPWFNDDGQGFQLPQQALASFFDALKAIYLEGLPSCPHEVIEGYNYCHECGRPLTFKESLGTRVAYWALELFQDREHRTAGIFGSDFGLSSWAPCDAAYLLDSQPGEVLLVYETEKLLQAYLDDQALPENFKKTDRGRLEDWEVSFWR